MDGHLNQQESGNTFNEEIIVDEKKVSDENQRFVMNTCKSWIFSKD